MPSRARHARRRDRTAIGGLTREPRASVDRIRPSWSIIAMTHYQVFFLLLGACSGYALLCGAQPERITALIFIAAGVVTPLVLRTFMARYRSPEVGEVVVDAAMYAALLGVAIYADRYWTLWMSALQGIQLSSHLLGFMHGPSANLAYAIIAHLLSYPMMILLAVAVYRHKKRLPEQKTSTS